MAYVATYLNFDRNCEEAFNFYKSIFGGGFESSGISRYGEVPPAEDQPQVPEEDKNLIMNVGLKILDGHLIMGADMCEWMGQHYTRGNNFYITLSPDSRTEADSLFKALSEGGKVETPMTEMFWGDYYGSFMDRFGVQWMINTPAKE